MALFDEYLTLGFGRRHLIESVSSQEVVQMICKEIQRTIREDAALVAKIQGAVETALAEMDLVPIVKEAVTAEIRSGLKRIEDLTVGRCPDCGEKVGGYQAPVGFFGPEMWATLREDGIDPATGHKERCPTKRRLR